MVVRATRARGMAGGIWRGPSGGRVGPRGPPRTTVSLGALKPEFERSGRIWHKRTTSGRPKGRNFARGRCQDAPRRRRGWTLHHRIGGAPARPAPTIIATVAE